MTGPKPARTFTTEDRQATAEAKRKRQAEHDQAVWPRISELRDQGMNWHQVCRALEAEGFKTTRGSGRWQPVQLQRIARRQANTPTLQAPSESRLRGFLQRLRRCLTP